MVLNQLRICSLRLAKRMILSKFIDSKPQNYVQLFAQSFFEHLLFLGPLLSIQMLKLVQYFVLLVQLGHQKVRSNLSIFRLLGINALFFQAFKFHFPGQCVKIPPYTIQIVFLIVPTQFTGELV